MQRMVKCWTFMCQAWGEQDCMSKGQIAVNNISPRATQAPRATRVDKDQLEGK